MAYILFLVVYLVNIFCSGCIFAFTASVQNMMDSDLEQPHKLKENFCEMLASYRDKTDRVMADSAGFLAMGTMLTMGITGCMIYVLQLNDVWGFWTGTFWLMLIAVFFYMLFSVYLPYSICSEKPMKFLPFSGYIYRFFDVLFTPLFQVHYFWGRNLARLFGVDYTYDSQDVTEEEIISMIQEGHEQGTILGTEAKMIQNILDFDDKIAKDIMTHRPDIVGMDGEMCMSEAVRFVIDNHFSRYPVYIEDLDHVIGLVHIKEILEYANQPQYHNRKIRDIDGLLRTMEFVPETHGINTLFTTMQLEKSHMVMIVDEYGQTSGLVAMEDILEEIVGNIEDEHDETEASVEELAKDHFQMHGSTTLTEVSESLGIDFQMDDVETLNGLLINELHRIPEEHEVLDVDYQGFRFHICDVRQNVIQQVRVSPVPPSVETDEEK